MRVAVAGLRPAPDAAAALGRARGLAAAAAAGADLLLLPQRFAGEAAAAEPSDGPLAGSVRALAAEAGVAVAYGYAERCTGQDYDAVQLVDAGGRALANYRRTHVGEAGEGGRFARGQWLTAMPLAGRRVGLLCGYDLAFPEAARALRLVGCDVLLVAAGGGDGVVGTRPLGTLSATLLAAVRAAENAFCVALAAGGGPDGAAAALGPDGAPLAPAAEAGALLLVVDLPPPARGPGPLRDRRPRLYQRLTAEDAAGEARR